VNASRGVLLCGLVILGAVLFGGKGAELRAQTPAKSAAIVGGWTLNRDLSDQPPGGPGQNGDQPAGSGGSGNSGNGYGGGRRGGRRSGYGNQGGQGGDPEEMARIRSAMSDLLNPPAHLIVADTGSLIVMTAPDGRTTRLSPDGKKIKDDNTKVERKTKWDGDKLVSEINGLGPNKITQSFSADPEHHQLHIALQIENKSGQPRMVTQIYDQDAK
jgi:hypothetical protein